MYLDGVEEVELVEGLEGGVVEGRLGQRGKVKQVGVGGVLVGQDEVLEGHGDDGLTAHPAVRDGTDVVLWGQWLEDGDGEGHDVRLVLLLLVQQPGLAVVDPLRGGVLDPDPPRLHAAVPLVVPAEGAAHLQRDPQNPTGDGLDGRTDVQARQLPGQIEGDRAGPNVVAQLAHALALADVEDVLRAGVLLLQVADDIDRQHALKLPQGRLRPPHPPVDGLAKAQKDGGHRAPALAQADLEERTGDASGVAGHVVGVRDDREAGQLGVADVGLQQHVGLAHAVLHGPDHVERAGLGPQLVDLIQLLRPHADFLELLGRADDVEGLGVGHMLGQEMVKLRHRLMPDVVVAGGAAHVRDRQVARPRVVAHHAILVQDLGRVVDEPQALLFEHRVLEDFFVLHAVDHGVLEHADVEVGVGQPGHALLDARDRARHHLGIEVIGQLLDEGALDGHLVGEQGEVAGQGLLRGDEDGLAARAVLRPARAPEDLHHVEHAQIGEPALVRVVHLSALDHDRVGGQVDAPGERGRAHQDLEHAVAEHVLGEAAVGPQHAGVVDAEPVGEVLAQVGVAALGGLRGVALVGVEGRGGEVAERAHLHGLVAQGLGRAGGVLARVHEDHHLVPPADRVQGLGVGQVVHEVELAHLLLLRHADEGHVQRHRAVLGPEVEKPALRRGAEKEGHVLVVGQRRRKAHQPHGPLRRLDLALRAGDDGLNHRPTLIRQQVHLINDDEPHNGGQRPLPALPGHHVPLLRRRDDELRLLDLLLAQLHVARHLLDHEAQVLQPLREGRHHLLRQGLHRGHIDGLQARLVDQALGTPAYGVPAAALDVVLDEREEGEHGNVGLAGARGGADEKVLLAVVGRVEDRGLDAVQLLEVLERQLCPGLERLGHVHHLHGREGLGLVWRGDVHLLVPRLVQLGGIGGQALLGLEQAVAALRQEWLRALPPPPRCHALLQPQAALLLQIAWVEAEDGQPIGLRDHAPHAHLPVPLPHPVRCCASPGPALPCRGRTLPSPPGGKHKQETISPRVKACAVDAQRVALQGTA